MFVKPGREFAALKMSRRPKRQDTAPRWTPNAGRAREVREVVRELKSATLNRPRVLGRLPAARAPLQLLCHPPVLPKHQSPSRAPFFSLWSINVNQSLTLASETISMNLDRVILVKDDFNNELWRLE